MALYIPHTFFHLARLLYVRPETFRPSYYVFRDVRKIGIGVDIGFGLPLLLGQGMMCSGVGRLIVL